MKRKKSDNKEIRRCCKIDCNKKAEYEIWYGDKPGMEDYSDSCAKHIGDLLGDYQKHTLHRLDGTIWVKK